MLTLKRVIPVIMAVLLVFTMVPVTGTAYAADGSVAINESNFPDPIFREYLNSEYNTDGDEFLSASEIENIWGIAVYEVNSLKGIELFPDIDYLYTYGYFDSVDLTKNTKLTRINIDGPNLTELNISGLEELTNLCTTGCESLGALDISGCTKLLEAADESYRQAGVGGSSCVTYEHNYNKIVINGWTDLIYNGEHHLYGLPITKANFPDEYLRTDLRSKSYDADQDGTLSDEEIADIKSIGIRPETVSLGGLEYLTELESFYLQESSVLTKVDLSKNTKLKTVSVEGNANLKTLNIKGLTELEKLFAYDTGLKEIDLTTNTSLTHIMLYRVPGLKIDITGNERLIYAVQHGKGTYREDIDQQNYYANTKGVSQFAVSGTAKLIYSKPKNTITASDVTKNYSTKKQTFTLSASAKGDAPLTFKSANTKYVTIGKTTGKVSIVKTFVGKATITITSAETDQYASATKTVTVKVVPAKAAISSVKNTSSKKITVKWKKSATATITGYEIQYSTKKDFSSKTIVRVKGYSKTSKVISNLKKGKTYYVRVRAYLKSGNAYYNSPWSAVKSVKITK